MLRGRSTRQAPAGRRIKRAAAAGARHDATRAGDLTPRAPPAPARSAPAGAAGRIRRARLAWRKPLERLASGTHRWPRATSEVATAIAASASPAVAARPSWPQECATVVHLAPEPHLAHGGGCGAAAAAGAWCKAAALARRDRSSSSLGEATLSGRGPTAASSPPASWRLHRLGRGADAAASSSSKAEDASCRSDASMARPPSAGGPGQAPSAGRDAGGAHPDTAPERAALVGAARLIPRFSWRQLTRRTSRGSRHAGRLWAHAHRLRCVARVTRRRMA